MVPILYQDSALLVCLKPAGVLSQAGPGEDLLSLLSRQEQCALFPVHRLDRGVGGVMVFAKTSRAAAALSDAVQRRQLQKLYLCVVHGQPEEDAGVYRDLLFHDRARNKSFVVTRTRSGVKEAALEYRVLDRRENLSLVWVRLHTGRTHQIRVQFASRKTPLVGDVKYGGGSGSIALWSCSLSFPHPATGKVMTFCRLPSGGIWDAFPIQSLLQLLEC